VSGGYRARRCSGAFPGMRAQVGGMETVLTGAPPDQAALHGVLTQIEALGLNTSPSAELEAGSCGRTEQPTANLTKTGRWRLTKPGVRLGTVARDWTQAMSIYLGAAVLETGIMGSAMARGRARTRCGIGRNGRPCRWPGQARGWRRRRPTRSGMPGCARSSRLATAGRMSALPAWPWAVICAAGRRVRGEHT
jgi:hypothetical protein